MDDSNKIAVFLGKTCNGFGMSSWQAHKSARSLLPMLVLPGWMVMNLAKKWPVTMEKKRS